MFSRITNLRTKFFSFLLKQGTYFRKKKRQLATTYFKRQQVIFLEKKFVESKFAETCHEPIIYSTTAVTIYILDLI